MRLLFEPTNRTDAPDSVISTPEDGLNLIAWVDGETLCLQFDAYHAAMSGQDSPAGVKVLVATKPVDFRRDMDSLARAVKEEWADLFSGVVYVFRAKRMDMIKLLYWDGSGVVYSTPSGWRTAPSSGCRSAMG